MGARHIVACRRDFPRAVAGGSRSHCDRSRVDESRDSYVTVPTHDHKFVRCRSANPDRLRLPLRRAAASRKARAIVDPLARAGAAGSREPIVHQAEMGARRSTSADCSGRSDQARPAPALSST